MSNDPLYPANPYRPYVVPLDSSPHLISHARSTPRDLLADLDIPTDYLENPELSDLISNLVTQGISRYASIFIRQPFEIVKTTMQLQFFASAVRPVSPAKTRRPILDSDEEFEEESDSEDDPPLFSGGESPLMQTRGRSRKRAGQSISPSPSLNTWQLPTQATGVRSILSALWTKEGTWGIWKGTNSTFIYSVLFDGIETWLSSLIAATFALPDPSLFDILDSPTPGASLAAALSATAITAVLLAPLDIYRITKMILPGTTSSKPAVKTTPLPLTIPTPLLFPTLLHAILPNYLSSLFTLSLRPYFPHVSFSPSHYGLPFLASFLDLGIRLPLESILRRAQIAYSAPEKTIVPVGQYKGVVGTTWSMCVEERGGVFRGWRIGFWGLMMVWVLKTTNALGRGQDVEF